MSGSAHARESFVLAVPYYAGLELLEQTLRSVVAQDDRDWRCVVVDDSPVEDGAAALVHRIADDRITYRRNEHNLGVAGSFERCFEVGDELGATLVAIVHADDVLEPSFVCVARAAHEREPSVTCVAPRVTVIGADGAPARTLPDTVKDLLRPRGLDRLVGERGLRILLRGQFFHCPSVSYRLSLVPRPAWDPRWRQVMDLELYGRVLLDGGTILLEPARTYRYRRHTASATAVNSVSLARSEEETALCLELAAAARSRGWRRAERAGRIRLAVRLQAGMRSVTSLVARRPAASWHAARLAFGRSRTPGGGTATK